MKESNEIKESKDIKKLREHWNIKERKELRKSKELKEPNELRESNGSLETEVHRTLFTTFRQDVFVVPYFSDTLYFIKFVWSAQKNRLDRPISFMNDIGVQLTAFFLNITVTIFRMEIR